LLDGEIVAVDANGVPRFQARYEPGVRSPNWQKLRLNVSQEFRGRWLQPRQSVRRAPAGVVATVKLKERLGERVGRGDLIAKIYEQSTVTAEIMVSEKEIADVSVGQTVVLKARAFPERSFTSRITAIAPIAVEEPSGLGGRAIRVMTEIDNRSGLLKSEMTGNAKVHAGNRRIFDLATRRLAHYIRVEFWSWW
jgi:Barrel-sandwich domain of CusB or HlyD membrane-fusion